MENPLISVVMPAHNSAPFVSEAIRSALGQTYRNIEIIVLDDASTDNTNQIVEKLRLGDSRIRCHRNTGNMGAANTRNRGLSLAEGGIVAFLDSDDVWAENKLELQIAHMREYRLDICYTGYSFIDRSGQSFGKPYPAPETLTMKRLIKENVIGCSTALMRKSAVSGIKMRPEYAHEDYVFWLELMQKGCRFGGIREPLVRYRVMDTSRSGNKRKAAASRWKIYRDFLGMNPFSASTAFISYAARGIVKYYF